jgi:hypothetical protein
MRGLPRCVVGMEATGGAQYWARQFTALGHAVRLMSPALVMPYRKGNHLGPLLAFRMLLTHPWPIARPFGGADGSGGA